MAKEQAKGTKKKQATAIKPLPQKTTNKPKDKSQTNYYFPAAAALVTILTFVVFLPSLSLGFVNWDDPYNLTENETLKVFATQWSWSGVKEIFTTDVIGNYNPLPVFTFAIEKYFFARNPLEHPFVFHFNNVWMHVLCTLFVFLIFTKLGMSRIAAINRCFVVWYSSNARRVGVLDNRTKRCVIRNVFSCITACLYQVYKFNNVKIKMVCYCFIAFCFFLFCKSTGRYIATIYGCY
jgi:hypothetical protein